MTINAKSDAAKAGRVRNAGTSQAVSQKAGDNLFDQQFAIVPAVSGYWLLYPATRDKQGLSFHSLDSLMTFLADQAIEKMGRVEQ
jgi:hypothetical protein